MKPLGTGEVGVFGRRGGGPWQERWGSLAGD